MKKIVRRRAKREAGEGEIKAPDIKIRFAYTYDDYMEANACHWAGRRTVYIVCDAALLLLSLLHIAWHPSQGRGYVAALLSLIFLLMLTKFFRHYLDFTWRWNRALRQTFDAAVTGEHLTITGERGGEAIEWAQVYRLAETRNLFLVYQRARDYLIIPKRAFLAGAAGVGGLNDFRDFVNARAETSPRRRRA